MRFFSLHFTARQLRGLATESETERPMRLVDLRQVLIDELAWKMGCNLVSA